MWFNLGVRRGTLKAIQEVIFVAYVQVHVFAQLAIANTVLCKDDIQKEVVKNLSK